MENELKNNKDIALFENKKIRKEVHNNEWYFSVVDIIEILTESKIPKRYWTDLKKKFENEGNFETYDKIVQLKLIAEDGKKRLTDCTDTKGLLRIIQSIPSPKAEPFKQWLAKIRSEQLEEIANPELAIQRGKETFIKKGYDNNWISQRLKTTDAKNTLTDTWKEKGIAEHKDYAILRNEIYKNTFGLDTKQYKKLKGIDKSKQNLRDSMGNLELAITNLSEVTANELHQSNNSFRFNNLKSDVVSAGKITGKTRLDIESKLGRKIVTDVNYKTLTKNNNKHLEDK
ncbi:MAG: BRO family protein [Clostridia bacterium]